MQQLRDTLNLDCQTVSGKSWGEVLGGRVQATGDVIRDRAHAMQTAGGLAVLRGNLAPNGCVLRLGTATPNLLQHRGRALVFENYEDMLTRIDDLNLDVTANSVLVLRNAGAVGVPGLPEWGSIPIPKKLLLQGVQDMVRISDSRMSGTSYGTVLLHVSPEAAVGGPLALVQNGDWIELDVAARTITLDVSGPELAQRRAAWQPPAFKHLRGYPRLYAQHVLQPDEGCDFDFLQPNNDEALRFVPPVVGRS
jgi:dihydroxy-acid dehydratase